eukprot:20421-Pleurochrysis_carterae.AAC.2
MGVGGVTEKEREALQREMNELRSALAAERERQPAAAATAMAVSAGVALIEASDDAHEDRGLLHFTSSIPTCVERTFADTLPK